MKTTHKPRQELKPVKITKSYRYAEIRHKTVTFLYGKKSNENTRQTIHSQYDVRSLVHGVSIPFFMQKLYTPFISTHLTKIVSML